MTAHAQAFKTSAWALDTALNLFQWDRVAMVLFAIFVVRAAAANTTPSSRHGLRHSGETRRHP